MAWGLHLSTQSLEGLTPEPNTDLAARTGVAEGAAGGVPGLIDFTLVTAQVGSLVICLTLWKDSHI